MQSLSFRIFAGLLIVLLGTFALYSYLTLRFYTDQTLTQVYEAAYRASDVIKSSTHYSMMLNRKEDVYQIIRTIGREPGVDGIRIYNKRGLITFSTDSTEAGTLVDLNAEACFGCHERSRPLSSLPMSNRMRVYSGSDGYRLVGLINPVRNEVGCGGGGCHESPQERSVLGVLDVRMSLQRVDQDIATMRRRAMVHTVLALLGIATASGIFVAVTIRRPVRRLIRGTEQITAGHLDHEIPVTSTDELGRLAHSFNEMTRSLQRAQEENQTWAWTLEERVREKSAELQKVHDQIMQIERMASLGKLSASVAHELNNPLAGILAYTRLVERRLKRGALTEELTRECLSDLELIGRETARCGNIARNLLLFSRRQTSDMAVIAVREIIARAARLIAHHMEMAHVRLESSCRPADLCFIGDEDQAQQALVALFVNAVEAMPDGGTLRVVATEVAGAAPAAAEHPAQLRIVVSDTGVGIRPEDLPHVFEPFFSSKQDMQGTGLGLSIVYGIIERHGGTITVQSQPGQGATFTIRLPRAGPGGMS